MRLLVTMAAALALAGCWMGKDMSATEGAGTDVHQKLNAGQFATITNSAGPEIKSGATDFPTLHNADHRKLGAIKSTARQGFNDNYNNGDHLFTATYASVYES